MRKACLLSLALAYRYPVEETRIVLLNAKGSKETAEFSVFVVTVFHLRSSLSMHPRLS